MVYEITASAPYTEFDGNHNIGTEQDLASQLISAVSAERLMLERRGFTDTLRRWSSLGLADALAAVKSAQAEHREGQPFRYGLLDADARLRGEALLYPDLPLRRQQWPFGSVPAGIVPRGFRRTYPYATHYVAAWIEGDHMDEEYTRQLAKVYSGMIALAGTLHQGMKQHSWTIEDARAPAGVQRAVQRSGLYEIARGNWDDGLNPRSKSAGKVLYAELKSTGHIEGRAYDVAAALFELRHGEQRPDEFDAPVSWPGLDE